MKAVKEGNVLDTTEHTYQQDLERLKLLRYMDDNFMTVCLADNFEGVELILRIVLGREDITVKSVRTQEPMKNLQGRSGILDVHAVDSTKKEFDVEIQRKDVGAVESVNGGIPTTEQLSAAADELGDDMKSLKLSVDGVVCQFKQNLMKLCSFAVR